MVSYNYHSSPLEVNLLIVSMPKINFNHTPNPTLWLLILQLRFAVSKIPSTRVFTLPYVISLVGLIKDYVQTCTADNEVKYDGDQR